MNDNLEGMNLIDLISEKHIVLRRQAEDRWAAEHNEEINHTEAFLLARIGMKKISLAEAARQANISRQAMFKCAKKLEERGYLSFVSESANSKYAVLTEKGQTYCKNSQQLKEAIEDEISNRLGKKQVQILKDLLQVDWFMSEPSNK